MRSMTEPVASLQVCRMEFVWKSCEEMQVDRIGHTFPEITPLKEKPTSRVANRDGEPNMLSFVKHRPSERGKEGKDGPKKAAKPDGESLGESDEKLYFGDVGEVLASPEAPLAQVLDNGDKSDGPSCESGAGSSDTDTDAADADTSDDAPGDEAEVVHGHADYIECIQQPDIAAVPHFDRDPFLINIKYCSIKKPKSKHPLTQCWEVEGDTWKRLLGTLYVFGVAQATVQTEVHKKDCSYCRSHTYSPIQ